MIDRASPRITWKPSLIATSTPTNVEPALRLEGPVFLAMNYRVLKRSRFPTTTFHLWFFAWRYPDAELSTSNRSTVLMESSGSSHRMD